MYKRYFHAKEDDDTTVIPIPKTTKRRWRKRMRLSDVDDSEDEDLRMPTLLQTIEYNSCTGNAPEIATQDMPVQGQTLEPSLVDTEVNERDRLDENTEFHPGDAGIEDQSSDLLYVGARILKSESNALIVSYMIKHNVTTVAMVDLLQLINIHCPEDCVPTSKYRFQKLLENPKDVVTRHYYCDSCFQKIEHTDTSECTNRSCKKKLDFKCAQSDSYFFSIPLAKQLQNILENTDVYESVLLRRNESNSNTMTDVCDGLAYKLIQQDPKSPLGNKSCLTASIGFDGAPVFNSSPFSIWAILCVINEFPPAVRKKYVFMVGLWFGKCKPHVDTYFEPIRRELEDLSENGFRWQHPVSSEEMITYVLAVLSVCDTIARPILQSMKQFNAYFGCSFCLHPGIYVEKGRGGNMVYPVRKVDNHDDVEEFEQRTRETCIQDAQKAVSTGTLVNGVIGFSVLTDVPYYDYVTGQIPDYMHCVLLGVVRYFLNLWLDSSNHKEGWYMGNLSEDIDAKLLQIKPPTNISRVPRSVNIRKYWKAHEWRSWLFFYSLPVLKGLLADVYITHWSLLVESVGVLLQESVEINKLDTCHQMLIDFVDGIEKLYGIAHCTFNSHLLTHLVQSVRNWGPLWAHSAFVFENFNQVLLDLVKSSNNVPQQIIARYLIFRSLPQLRSRGNGVAFQPAFVSLMDKFASKHHVQNAIKHLGSSSEITVLGKSRFQHILTEDFNSYTQVQFTFNSVDIDRETLVSYFQRIICNGEIIHAESYKKVTKRNNFTVVLNDGNYFLIQKFVTLKECTPAESVFAVGCYIHELPSRTPFGLSISNLKVLNKRFSRSVLIPCSLIKGKCVFVGFEGSDVNFLSILPNKYESLWI